MFYRASSRKGGTCIAVPGAARRDMATPDSPSGSGPDATGEAKANRDAPKLTRNVDVRLQDRPLVGVLLSASADGMGEIFPIYLGKNTIGRKQDCDVRLNEATVSLNHAVILVRTATDEHGQIRLNASLTDYSLSDYGSNVDGVQAEYDKLMIQNGSTICIGRGYVFTIYLFNPWIPGFGQNPVFAQAEEFRSRERMNSDDDKDIGSRQSTEPEIGAGAVGADDEFSFYGRPLAEKKTDHSRAATVTDRQDFYNGATRRNPDAAPGTVIK